VVDEGVLKLKPGPISHSRWQTTGNRFERLYVSKHKFKGKTKENLILIVTHAATLYFIRWFDIKCEPSFLSGPKHVLKEVCIVRDILPKKITDVIFKFVESGAWMAHSEVLLLSLICSQDEEERRFAINKILQIRGNVDVGSRDVRDYHVPQLNWNAQKLVDLIDWEHPLRIPHEPLLTCHLKNEELRQFLDRPFEVTKYPVHTQSVERCVKEVTEASAAVFGPMRRDGYIRARMEAREMVPINKTKADLLGMLQKK
jgi:hypothetical protein